MKDATTYTTSDNHTVTVYTRSNIGNSKIAKIKTIKQMEALMKKPTNIIKNPENGKTIGRIYRSQGFTTVKLYAWMLEQSFECTAHAVEFVEAKIGKTVEVV